MSRGATYYTLLAALRQQELLDEAEQRRAVRHARSSRSQARRPVTRGLRWFGLG